MIGYSGGKDSTAVPQAVWYGLARLSQERLKKPVFVIASDTLVETPVIVGHITRTLARINEAAAKGRLPISAHKVSPEVDDTFWVNLIGRGYPFLLKGILRCKCGHMMTSYFSTGRAGTLHFYYSCTNRTHGGRLACDAPYVPAKALDDAVVQRVLDLAGDEQAQDRIIRMAIGMADHDARRIQAESEQVRRRMAENQTEVNNLIRVLKTLGEGAIASVQDGLKEAEAERQQLREKLDALAREEESLGQLTRDAERFLRAWTRVKDLSGEVSPGTKREMIQHLVEALDWMPADSKGKTGTYRLTFFPEVLSERDHNNGPDGGGDGWSHPDGTPQKKKRTGVKPGA